MEGVAVLAREVLRLFNCPYAASLKRLSDVVKETRPQDIQLWTDLNDCQIRPLACVILEQWQVQLPALEILLGFAHIVRLRDELLYQNALLLPSLLRQARSPDGEGRLYQHLCAKLLSSPFPKDVPLPCDVHELFLSLVEAIAADGASCLANFRSLYMLLKGIGADALATFPLMLWSPLQDNLLRNIKDKEDHQVHLYSLAIMAQLAGASINSKERSISRSGDRNDINGLSESVGPQDVLITAQQFFNGKRASKTLQLVVLRAICCSSSCEFAGDSDGVDGCLSLVLRVVDCVDVDQKQKWVSCSSSLVRKLRERISRVDLSVSVRFQVLRIATSLVGQEAVAGIADPFIQNNHEQLMQLQNYAESYNLIVSGFPTALVAKQLASLAGLAKSRPQDFVASFYAMRNGLELLEIWLGATKREPNLRAAAIAALSQDTRAHHPESSAVQSVAAHEAHLHCQETFLRLSGRLRKGLLRLLLTSSMYALEGESRLEDNQIANLTADIFGVAGPTSTCTIFIACQDEPRRLFPTFTGSAQILDLPSPEDWRTWLGQELMKDASNIHEKIIRNLGRAFGEWELQCTNIEKPLREERVRSNSLLAQLDQCRAAYAELEAKQHEQVLLASSLEADNISLTACKMSLEEELDGVTKSFDQLQGQFEASKQREATATNARRISAERRELEVLASLAAKDEMNENKTKLLMDMEEKCRNLQERLAEETRNLIASERTNEACRQQRNELQSTLRSSEEKSNAMQEALSDLEERLHLKESETAAFKHESSKHEGELKADIAALESAITEINRRGDAALHNATSLHQTEREELRRKISALEASNISANDEAERHISKLETRCAKQASRVESLERQNKSRAKEFAEAQNLGKKLMAVMRNSESPTSSNQLRSPTSKPRRDEVANTANEIAHPSGSNNLSFEGSRRHTSHPETPLARKRNPTGIGAQRRTHASAEGTIRRPLADLGYQQTRPRDKASSDSKNLAATKSDAEAAGNVSMDEFADLSFGDSVVFTSAEDAETVASEERLADEIDDGTTIDFG